MSLRQVLERERRAIARLLRSAGAVTIAGALAIALALGVFLLGGARWLALPRLVPFVLWGIAGALVAYGARWLARRLGRDATLPGVAGEVERERSLRDGSLRGALEVAESGPLGRLGADQMVERLRRDAQPVLAPAYRRVMRRRLVLGGAGALLGILLLVTGVLTAPDGWAALLHPVRAWRGTLLDGVRLASVPSAVLRGEHLTVDVRAPGRRSVTIAQRRTGASWRFVTAAVTGGSARVTLEPVDADLTVYATDGRATSDTAVVKVVERPFLGDVTIRARFPRYLDRPDESVPLGEPVRLPQGAVLAFEGQSSTTLRDVRLAHGADTLAMIVDGRRFSGRLTTTASGRFEWSASGAAGPITDVPAPLDLEVIPDSAPRVEILAPAGDTTVSAGDTVALSLLATDDHGLAGVALESWIVTAAGQAGLPASRAIAREPATQWAGDAAVATDSLRPGDAMHLRAVATDASPWQLRGESRELVLRFPTLSEQRTAARAAADSTVARAAATAAAQKQLAEQTSNAARQRQPAQDPTGKGNQRGQNAMSYEAAEQARALAAEQRQLADRMQQLQGAARQLEQQLRQAGALDSGLQARLEEAQRLLQQALTPELAEQLRKLEEASQKLSENDARKALADLAQQQQRLREQLEKSVEMLKRAAIEGAMSTLRDEARDLADKERQLAESLAARAAQPGQDSAATRRARELSDRSRNLSDDVKQLQQRLQQQNADAGSERVAEAGRRVDQSTKEMDRATQPSAGQRSARARADSQQASAQARADSQQASAQAGQQRQQGGAKRGGASQPGARQGGSPRDASGAGGRQGGEGRKSADAAARDAAGAMQDAANELAKAREQQVSAWKQELTQELDRSIQELMQLSRAQDALEQRSRQGASPSELRPDQSTLQQGVDKSAQRLVDASRKSSLLSQRSLRMVSDAQRRVEEATRTTTTSTNPTEVANVMRDAGDALNQAAASLVGDRERAQSANSASGFAEMLQQLQQMAQQQSALNSAVQQLLPRPGARLDAQGQQESRQLARQQRDVAAQLDDVSDRDNTGRAEELAKEARAIAQALDVAQIDPAVLDRQQRLFRRMLDAGRLLEEDQREDTGKREAKAWTGTDLFTPTDASASGRAATRFAPPTWNDLRGLTPEERRLVLEYFKKINGGRP